MTGASENVFVCVNCGAEMTARHCKLRCPRCGAFEDCSDGACDPTNAVPRPATASHA